MGGFGSGGNRTGAGRKTKDAKLAVLHNSRDRGTRPVVHVSDVRGKVEPSVKPPTTLSAAALSVWKELAPFASAQKTLTPEHAMAFSDLCEAVAMRREMAAQIALDGLMVNVFELDEDGTRRSIGQPVKHPLLAEERGYRLRVEAGYGRFRLSPDGKERGSDAGEKPEQTAFEKLQAQSSALRRPPVGVPQ